MQFFKPFSRQHHSIFRAAQTFSKHSCPKSFHGAELEDIAPTLVVGLEHKTRDQQGLIYEHFSAAFVWRHTVSHHQCATHGATQCATQATYDLWWPVHNTRRCTRAVKSLPLWFPPVTSAETQKVPENTTSVKKTKKCQ